MVKRKRSHLHATGWLDRPIIPVIRQPADHPGLGRAARTIFLQGGNINDLPSVLGQLQQPAWAQTTVMLHLDLLGGVASDEYAVTYLAGFARIDGIITVRHHLIPAARKAGLATILRLFLTDGRALKRGLGVAENAKPDAIELLPGVAAIEAAPALAALPIPRIAGGLVRRPEVVQAILDSGCGAISTSEPTLWNL